MLEHSDPDLVEQVAIDDNKRETWELEALKNRAALAKGIAARIELNTRKSGTHFGLKPARYRRAAGSQKSIAALKSRCTAG
jgi:hypothetical protein